MRVPPVLAPLLALGLLSGLAQAAPEAGPEPAQPEPFFEIEPGEPELMGDLRPWTALGAIESGRFVRARELAESIVRGDPNSCLLYTSPSPRD